MSSEPVNCGWCKRSFLKELREIRRARARNGIHYCTISCSVSAQNSARGGTTAALNWQLMKVGIDPGIAWWIADLSVRAKRRAISKGLDWDMDHERIVEMAARSGGRCAISGVQFRLVERGKHHRQPFAPSFDRIDSVNGYVTGNTRLICVAANLALNSWGETVFREIAIGVATRAGYRYTTRRTKTPERVV
jgi:hypothetical protein